MASGLGVTVSQSIRRDDVRSTPPRHSVSAFVLALLASLFLQSLVYGQDWERVAAQLDASVFRMEMAGADGVAGCSAWLFNASDDLVVTAEHCTPAAVTFTIDDLHAEVVASSVELDIAVLHVEGITGTALTFRAGPAVSGMRVATIGYPMGSLDPIFRAGWVAGPAVRLPTGVGVLLDLHVQSGQSGSPVVDRDGALVTMVRRTLMDPLYRPITMGISSLDMLGFLEPYAQ